MTPNVNRFTLSSAPALWSAAALASGIWVSSLVAPSKSSILVLSICAICLSFLATPVKGAFRLIAIAFALFSAGASNYSSRILLIRDTRTNRFDEANSVRGMIVSFPKSGYGYWRMDFKILSVHTSTGNKQISGLVKLNIKNPPEKLEYGQVWEIDSRIYPLYEHSRNFYVRNNSEYLRKLGYSGNIWADGSECHLLDSERGNFLIRKIVQPARDRIRKAFYSVADSVSSAILSGIILGGDEDIDPKVMRAFSEAGVIHILSVSGLHTAMVAGLVWWLCRKARINRRLTAGITIGATLFYVLLAQWRPSAVRAGLQTAMLLLTPLFGRRTNLPNSIGSAALLILCFSPEQLFSLGFQLSFSTTLGIAFFYPKLIALANPIMKTVTRATQLIVETIAVSLSAQMGALPIVAYYFHKIQIVAPLANLIIVPTLTPTLILGLLGGLLWNVHSILGKPLIFLASLGAKFAYISSDFLSGHSFSSIPVSQQHLIFLALFWVCAISVALWKRHTLIKTVGVLSGLVFVGSLIPMKEYPSAVFFSIRDGWAIYVSDGKRDGVILNCKASEIDRVISPFLFAQGKKAVDFLAIPNPYLTPEERKELADAIPHSVEVQDSSRKGDIAIKFLSRWNVGVDVSGQSILVIASHTQPDTVSADIVLLCESPEILGEPVVISNRVLLTSYAKEWRKLITNYYDLSKGALLIKWLPDSERVTLASQRHLP